MNITRSIESTIVDQLEKDTILLLIGARQVGKTTLLKHCKAILTGNKKIVHYFTLEDPLLLSDLNDHPENIFKYLKKDTTKKSFLLLDEIQYLNDPSNFLKYLYDEYQDNLKIVCTGSSAFYIDKRFKDSLAGRKRIIKIFPFSFSEFLKIKEPSLSELFQDGGYFEYQRKREFLTPQKRILLQHWTEYSLYGGYPRVVLEPEIEEKEFILAELHQSFLKKDIYESGIKNELKFFQLIRILASQCGELLNQNELANTLGVSRTAIENFIYVLTKSFIIDTCPTFQTNLRKELTKMPKVFMVDPGYRNSLLSCFKRLESRSDGGAAFENMLYSEFIKSRQKSIKYWRTQDQHEVDFVVNESSAFECKLSHKKFKTNHYKRFTESYPDIPLNLVVPEHDTYLDILDFCS